MKPRKSKALILSTLVISLTACVSTVPVYNVKSSNCPDEKQGLYYALPKTVVTADIVVSLTQIKAGPFYDLSKELLGIESEKNSKEYKIEEIKLGSYSVVDSSEWYFVDLSKNGLFKKVSITTTLAENGTISSASAEAENKTLDYTMQTITFAAGIAAKFIPFTSAGGSPVPQNNMLPEKGAKSPKGPVMLTHRDSGLLLISKIQDLQVKRTNLITNGESEIAADALQIMLKEIDTAIEGLMENFVGTKIVKKTTLHFDQEHISEKMLFNFSTKDGIFGLPASMNINKAFVTTVASGDPITLHFVNQQSIPAVMKTQSTQSSKSGFYYRIPVNTTVQVLKGNVVLNQADILIAQNGVTKSLPAKAGGGKNKYELKYDPKSGALLEIKVNGEPISAETINKITETGNTIMETIKPDELGELEKERKILEEKKKIKELLEAENN